MPKLIEEKIGPADIHEMARRLRECADACSAVANQMEAAKIDAILVAVKTGRLRMDQLEAFSRTLATRSKTRLNQIREERAKYQVAPGGGSRKGVQGRNKNDG